MRLDTPKMQVDCWTAPLMKQSPEMLHVRWQDNGSTHYDGRVQDVAVKYVESMVHIQFKKQARLWKAVVVELDPITDTIPSPAVTVSPAGPSASSSPAITCCDPAIASPPPAATTVPSPAGSRKRRSRPAAITIPPVTSPAATTVPSPAGSRKCRSHPAAVASQVVTFPAAIAVHLLLHPICWQQKAPKQPCRLPSPLWLSAEVS